MLSLLLQGYASCSVQWGAWAGSGMAAKDASTRMRVERTGLGLVESEAGLAALQGLLLQATSSTPALAAAVPIRWPKFLQQQFNNKPPAMFGEFTCLAAASTTPVLEASSAARSGRQRMLQARPRARTTTALRSDAQSEASMLQLVQESVAAVLGSADVDPQQQLMAAGLDSLSSVELKNSLEAKLGLELPTTLVFDYPTMAALAAFLASRVQPGISDRHAQAGSSDSESEADDSGLHANAAIVSGAVPVMARRSSRAVPRCRQASGTRAAISAEAQQALMLQQVQESVAAVLGSADVDPQQPLMAAGLDSLSSVELKNSLEAKLGLELPTTLVFDYPTMAALAAFLVGRLELECADESASEHGSYTAEASWEEGVEGAMYVAPARSTRQLIAVTGMAVRAPADALSSIHPKDAVQLVPASRWNLEANSGGCDACSSVQAVTLIFNPGAFRLRVQMCLVAFQCDSAPFYQVQTCLMPPHFRPLTPRQC